MADTPSRKLAVILHADVVGSTTLVHKDESLAHERIQGAFQRLSKTTASYGGITQEIRGYALLAEFSRASDAVCAALIFQTENSHYIQQLGDDIRAELLSHLDLHRRPRRLMLNLSQANPAMGRLRSSHAARSDFHPMPRP